MNTILLGIICGLVFGMVDVTLMIPLKFEDKRLAMLGAFASRFSIGFVIGISSLPTPPWLTGLIIGLLLSLPDAIITKSWAPIMGMGAIGGTIIGWVVGRWGV